MGVLSRTFDRFSTDRSEDVELKHDAEKAGCCPMAETIDRSVVSIHGVLRSVTLRPFGGVCSLEAELYDGTDRVTLIWLGRRRIEGIEAGRQLTASGRMGRRGTERVVYNPRYELTA